MIRIDFDPENHPEKLTTEQLAWWNAWKDRAQEATGDVLKAWELWRKNPKDDAYKKIFEKEKIKSVWGELKDWLLENLFYKKCAYCETPVSRSQFHAEHYRPKGRVIGENGKVKVQDDKGVEIDHPGYFWLAFHWKNLLPSCALCNTVNGKKNQFPIPRKRAYKSVVKSVARSEFSKLKEKKIQSETWKKIYYFQPVDLDELEGRVLLHPYFDEPQRYLRFDEYGNVLAIGNDEEMLRGNESIRIYNLASGDIVAERREAQTKAETKYDTAYHYYRDQGHSVSDARMKAKEAVAKYLAGQEPYSAAVIDFFKVGYPQYF